jgi:TRAP-type C4-dicarboxylate transport system substrate-binding protein
MTPTIVLSRRGLLAAGLAAPFLAVRDAAAQAAAEWRFFTYFPVNDKPAQLNRAFAEDVAQATGGRLRIRVFSAGELPYRAPDVVRAVATGQVQMGDVAVGFASGDIPEANVLAMPFLCNSYESFDRALPAVAPSVDELLRGKFGIEVGIHWTMPPQNIWLNRPVTTLAQLRGLKVRTWNPEQVEMMRLLGGSPISITSAEVIPALERRTIDAAITSALSANDWRAYDIVRTGFMANITMGHQVMMANGDAMRRLPGDVQQILRAKFQEWTPRFAAMSRQGDDEARANLRANRVTLVEPQAADIAAAQETLRPLWNGWAERHGATGRRLLDAAIAACVTP